MANNVALLPENAGRVTAPSLAYPYGSAKDDSTGSTGDGMPVKIAYFNDSFGMQQALLRAAGLVPTGNADTALSSQYLQAIIQQAAGRATQYDDTGAADAYVLALRTNQQAPGGLFDGLTVEFTPANANTGAATVDVSALTGDVPGTTVLPLVYPDGTDPLAGDIAGRTRATYNAALSRLEVATANLAALQAEIDDLSTPNNAGIKSALNATGDAGIFGARAWVSFSGTTVAINKSGNVSSVVDNATGSFTVNLIDSVEDSNSTVAVSTRQDSYQQPRVVGSYDITASSFSISCSRSNGGGTNTLWSSDDPSYVSAVLFN